MLVLCSGLFGCSTAPRSASLKLNLADHQIEQVQFQSTDAPAGADWREYQNFLVFPNSKIRIPLARSAMVQNELKAGFDPATLKLQWLKRDELLWISWTTLYQGSGGYTHDGNVVLQIRDGQSRELFRDHFESAARGGWMAQYYSSLKITYADRDKTFRFTRFCSEVNGDMGAPDPQHPFPFTVTFTNDDGKSGYLSKVETVTTWIYKLSGNKLKFLRGSSAVDLGDEADAVYKIASGFRVTRAALETMNPRLRHRQVATGIITLSQSIEPYQVSSDDGLGGDK